MVGLMGGINHSTHLSKTGITACADKYGFVEFLQLVLQLTHFSVSAVRAFTLHLLVAVDAFFDMLFGQLVVGHRIESTLKPIDIGCFIKRGVAWTGKPQAFSSVGVSGHAFVGGNALGIGAASFFHPNNLFWLTWLAQREREVGEAFAIGHFLGREEEAFIEGILCGEVDASGFEVAIKLLLTVFVLGIELMQFVITRLKGLCFFRWLKDALLAFFHGDIQQAVAYQVDQTIGRHPHFVVFEQLGMLLDETDDVEVLLLRWLEATGTVGRNKELVASHTAAITSDADIRRIANAITFVQLIAGILQDFLNAELLQEVAIFEFVFIHGLSVLASVTHVVVRAIHVHSCLEVSGGYIHGCIYTRLEIRAWMSAMLFYIDFRASMGLFDMLYVVDNICCAISHISCHTKSGQQCCTNLGTQTDSITS